MTTALRIDALIAGYDALAAVHGLNLTVNSGEIVALLGPNGAGKTTTLLTIAGLLPRLGGNITVLGQPVTRQRPDQIARLGVALVPEQRGVFYHLTAEQNLRLRHHAKSTASIDSVLEQLPALRRILKRRAGLLSGGEQQMLALACALTSDPSLLMVDEMSHGLAPVVVEQLLPALRSVAALTGMAVLLVEQHVHIALEVANRAYVLNRGRLVLQGATSELRQRLEDIEASYLDAAESITRTDGR
jgi:branched-chain amino acid transport system ATP-binding protein